MFISSVVARDINIDVFDIILEVDNVATIKDLVRQKYGVSVLPESTCRDEIMKKKLVALPIEKLDMKREINFLYTKNFQYGDFLKEIIRLYKELQ